jgi:hypothetical protein
MDISSETISKETEPELECDIDFGIDTIDFGADIDFGDEIIDCGQWCNVSILFVIKPYFTS